MRSYNICRCDSRCLALALCFLIPPPLLIPPPPPLVFLIPSVPHHWSMAFINFGIPLHTGQVKLLLDIYQRLLLRLHVLSIALHLFSMLPLFPLFGLTLTGSLALSEWWSCLRKSRQLYLLASSYLLSSRAVAKQPNDCHSSECPQQPGQCLLAWSKRVFIERKEVRFCSAILCLPTLHQKVGF